MSELNYDERLEVIRNLMCRIYPRVTVEGLVELDAALQRAKLDGLKEALDYAECYGAYGVVDRIKLAIYKTQSDIEQIAVRLTEVPHD